MLLNSRVLLFGALLAGLTCPLMRADFMTIAQPTAAYVNSTTLLDFTSPDYTLTGYLYGHGEMLIYDNLLQTRSIPALWGSWGTPPDTETATPHIGFTDGASELTITLGHAATTFGFELQPDNSAAEQTAADFYSGSRLVGTISLSPNGNGGALLYAASTTTTPFTSVVINDLTNLADSPKDFAIARQRFILAAPEPGTYALSGLALLLFLPFARRSEKSA